MKKDNYIPTLLIGIVFFLTSFTISGQNIDSHIEKGIDDYEISIRNINDTGRINIIAVGKDDNRDQGINGVHKFLVNKEDTIDVIFINGAGKAVIAEVPEFVYLQYIKKGTKESKAVNSQLYFVIPDDGTYEIISIPLWTSIIPPLIAIAFALIFKEVIISLFAGIFIGAFIIFGFKIEYFFLSLFRVIDKYIIEAIIDPGHTSVILFSLLIGGMVAIISRNGGLAGIVSKLSRFANSAKNSQLVTYFLGLAIFFDDYANTLIVGNTMRPVTDKYRVSREKLAYIVDSTAAPVAAIAFVTTWIGAELGYIGTQTELLGIEESAYSIFLNSLEFAFYPIFTLVFMLMLILMKRDFGPMRKAELRARETGNLYNEYVDQGDKEVDDSLHSLDPNKGVRLLWYNAFIPILTVVAVTITGLIISGSESYVWDDSINFIQNLSAIIGNADAYVALLWASLSGVIVAILLSIITKTISFRYSIESMMDGFKTMLPAIIILVLAWALAATTVELHTADFLTAMLSGNISPYVLGVTTFILAAIISFSTGSSWSTMAILYPLLLPTAWALSNEAGLSYEESMRIMYNVTAVILGGSVLGDHCSPISDTTILSSLASSCNHIDHVRTQLPYALTVGGVTVLCDGLLDYLKFPWWSMYLIGFALLFIIIKQFGKPVPESHIV